MIETIPILVAAGGLFYTLIFSPNNIASTHMRWYMYIVGFTQSRFAVIFSLTKGLSDVKSCCGIATPVVMANKYLYDTVNGDKHYVISINWVMVFFSSLAHFFCVSLFLSSLWLIYQSLVTINPSLF
jgi:hypothetical protein